MKFNASRITKASRIAMSIQPLVFSAALCWVLLPQLLHAQDAPRSQSTPPTTAATPAPPSSDAKKQADPPPVAATPAVTDPHQAQILADTQKLLRLSQELKAEVAKSNKDTLSLSVIKKAEEVEKLAKTLREEMSKNH